MKYIHTKAFILSILASLALVINNGTYRIIELRKAFQNPSYIVLLVTILIFIALLNLIPRVNKKNIKYGIPFSILSAIVLLLCESYFKTNSWDKVFGSPIAILTSGIKAMGIATMIFFVFDLICKINIEETDVLDKTEIKYKKILVLTAIMFIAWIPYMIILSPGCMNADTGDQIAQIIGNEEMCWTSRTIVRNEGDLLLNNHHPVFHTLILGAFIKFGQLIGTYAVGTELYCIIQCMIFAFTIIYSILKLKQFGISKRILKIVYLFFALCPLFPIWGMSTFKDIPFTIILLILTIILYELFKYPESFGKKKYIQLLVYTVLLMLMRNNGFYMILLLLPFVIIYFRKNKNVLFKTMAIFICSLVIFKVIYTGIIFSVCGIKNGSVREILSVPFQQTARYIKEHKNEITKKEEKIILKVLGNGKTTLDDIEKVYVPDRSDNVKGMYNKYTTSEDLIEYFKIWIKMFLKHPTTYIEAYLNLGYGWFCFDNKHDNIYYDGIVYLEISESIEGLNNPKVLNEARIHLYNIVKILDSIPLISCIFELSFYTWAYVIILIIMIIRKKYEILYATIPIFINYLICFIGPVVYMRYTIPMAVCIPFVAILTFANKKDEIKNVGEDVIWIK